MHLRTGGMAWIRLDKRMAIYARDGFDCVYCATLFPTDQLGYGLSLDHVFSRSNAPDNLVTACQECNSVRRDRSLRTWLKELAAQGFDWRVICVRLRRALRTPIDRAGGKVLAAQRRPNAGVH